MPTIRLNLDTNRACKIAYSKSHVNKLKMMPCRSSDPLRTMIKGY